MSDQSNHPFSHRRGPVFAVDPTGGASSGGSGGGLTADDTISKYTAIYQENMADQMKIYGATNELNKESNTMKSIMDVGMKVSKAVST